MGDITAASNHNSIEGGVELLSKRPIREHTVSSPRPQSSATATSGRYVSLIAFHLSVRNRQ